MIICLVGLKGSGKTTIANYCSEYYGFKCIAIADPLKELVKNIFTLTDEQVHDHLQKEELDIRWNRTPRQLLQWFGTDVMRNNFPTYWTDQLIEKIKNSDGNILISDIRFEAEVDAIKTIFQDVYIWKIIRCNDVIDYHSSEDYAKCANADVTLNNDGTITSLHHLIDVELLRKI